MFGSGRRWWRGGGGEWMRGLGWGFTNPVRTWEVLGVCLCLGFISQAALLLLLGSSRQMDHSYTSSCMPTGDLPIHIQYIL